MKSKSIHFVFILFLAFLFFFHYFYRSNTHQTVIDTDKKHPQSISTSSLSTNQDELVGATDTFKSVQQGINNSEVKLGSTYQNEHRIYTDIEYFLHHYDENKLVDSIRHINRHSLFSDSLIFNLAEVTLQQSYIGSEYIDDFAQALSYKSGAEHIETITAENAIDALTHLMYDIDDGYRVSVLTSILSWNNANTDTLKTRVEAKMFDFIHSTSTEVAITAVSALGKLNSKNSNNKLFEIAYSDNFNPELRIEAWRIISKKPITEEMATYLDEFNLQNGI